GSEGFGGSAARAAKIGSASAEWSRRRAASARRKRASRFRELAGYSLISRSSVVPAAVQSPISIWLRPRRYRTSGTIRSAVVTATLPAPLLADPAWASFDAAIGESKRITSR